LAFEKGVLAFENRVLAFENGAAGPFNSNSLVTSLIMPSSF
jgi:hypothetical protein